jgi:hypothetical protein
MTPYCKAYQLTKEIYDIEDDMSALKLKLCVLESQHEELLEQYREMDVGEYQKSKIRARLGMI